MNLRRHRCQNDQCRSKSFKKIKFTDGDFGRLCNECGEQQDHIGRIEQATVTTEGPGQGFIVQGGLIITAAHCVGGGEKRIGPGNKPRQQFVAFDGTKLAVELLYFEECYDIAIFGVASVNDSKSSTAKKTFEEFIEYVHPVDVAMDWDDREVPIKVFSHEGKWLDGTAERFERNDAIVWVTSNQHIVPGTSGSPILNRDNQAIAIVSVFSDSVKESIGPQPILSRCLPRYFLDQMIPQ